MMRKATGMLVVTKSSPDACRNRGCDRENARIVVYAMAVCNDGKATAKTMMIVTVVS